jgi:hypothetical protein
VTGTTVAVAERMPEPTPSILVDDGPRWGKTWRH